MSKISIFTAAFLCLAPAMALAQGYPGLSGGSGDTSASGGGGYGGLTSPAQRRAVVRPDAEQEGLSQTEGDIAAEQSLTPQQSEARLRAARQNNMQQTVQTGRFTGPANQNGEDLKMAAAIQENARQNRPSVLKNIRLSDRMLSAINKPREKVNGLWPQEAQAIQYVNTVFRDIQAAPAAEKRQKVMAAREQINAMIDTNLVTLAAPDTVSTNMGVAPEVVAQRKQAAAATNEKLKVALQKLR